MLSAVRKIAHGVSLDVLTNENLTANSSRGPDSRPKSQNLVRRRAQSDEPAREIERPVPAKRDHRQEVTHSVVKMLEDGVAPLQKPWESAGMPFNPTTDKAY